MPALSALVLLAGAAVASPASTPATCTAAQKAQRRAALTAFQKRMPAAKKAYFGHHRSAKLRKAFVARQQARLKALTLGASCTAPASTNPDAARMDLLVKYAGQMKALTFDPETSDAADEAIGTLAQDEEDCADDPTLDTCPLDNSEYTDTAKAVDDAATPLGQLATKVGAITPPAMAVTDYDASAGDCGVDLETVAAAHKAVKDANGTWADTLTAWGKAFANGAEPRLLDGRLRARPRHDQRRAAPGARRLGGHGALLLGRALRQGRLAAGRSGLDRRSRRRRVPV